MKETLKKFVDEICSTCKGNCDKGITFEIGEDKKVKCVDYVKDKNKVNKPQKKLNVTAKQYKPIMKDIV